MSFKEGPYVQAACLCEGVLEDKTGCLTLIRIIDTLTHTQASPNPPEQLPPFPTRFKLVIMLKSGMAQGRWTLKIVPSLPTGEVENAIVTTAHLDGEERGHNQIIDVDFVFRYEGLHWFKVYLDDELLTAVPVRIKYNRIIINQPAMA